ncbi:uncharacterized protein LOC126805054 [Argentina anserina]|uniref:uncharacterized protein LOC126805054 n=1 Tax=Argentina anserina TaxID=57926 RepID=UPI002176817D|nr:uncharacterized protein LOC126805054 [Potentilla anserina]
MEVAGWFIGAGIGTVFTALYEGVKKLRGRTTKFRAQLEALELTLESFDLEVIQQIGRHNEAMGLRNEDVKALEEELNKGVRIISELSDACLWNRIDSLYISQLAGLNRSLSILEKRLKMQSIRDVKETRHMMQILLIRLTLHQEPCRDGYGSLLSTTGLLNIAPQEALHHILTLDSVRNIASTSTDLQQFHGKGEIQEVGSSSGHLPSPLESSNYRGSDNQLEINGGQLVTTSYQMVKRIVVKVSLDSERSRSKALKLVVGIHGVYSSSIKRDMDQIEVIGDGFDVVGLVTKLRKHYYAEILLVEPVKSERKPTDPIGRKSKYIKICKWFKPIIPR